MLKSYEQRYGKKPKLRIITHSHGGNVALNLCRIESPGYPLVVDELIFLAIPVQYETKSLVHKDCFKKIYVFYSGGDLIQIIDMQPIIKIWGKSRRRRRRSCRVPSERYFPHADNVRQAKIKRGGWALSHSDFLLPKFLKHLPELIDKLDELYDTLPEEKLHREKLLHFHIRQGKTYIRTKIF